MFNRSQQIGNPCYPVTLPTGIPVPGAHSVSLTTLSCPWVTLSQVETEALSEPSCRTLMGGAHRLITQIFVSPIGGSLFRLGTGWFHVMTDSRPNRR